VLTIPAREHTDSVRSQHDVRHTVRYVSFV